MHTGNSLGIKSNEHTAPAARVFFATILLLLIALGTIAQEVPKAILVDEFEHASCDDFLARVDYFTHQLALYPDAIGYLVIAGDKEHLRQKLGIELMFEGALHFRARQISRIRVVRGRDAGQMNVQMWIGNPGNTNAAFYDTNWDFRVPHDSKPFLLRTDTDPICNPPPIDRVARDLLEANPIGSIYVIVHGSNARERRAEMSVARKVLVQFERSRVRYLLRTSNTAYSNYYFVMSPPKRKDLKSYW